MKECSKERGCIGKTVAGSTVESASEFADKMALRHEKSYLVYKCPHCGYYHITTKLENAASYPAPVHVSLARYDEVGMYETYMEPRNDGDWVLFEDVEVLLDLLTKKK